MINGLQARADVLGARRAAGGFRAKPGVEHGPVGDRAVSLAVACAKEGDREAVRFLYLRYADNVYGYVRSIVRDEYEAEDVTQHVFAKLITVIGKYEQGSVPFAAWIVRLAHNVAIDHIRMRRAIPTAEVSLEGTEDEAGDRARDLRCALAALPEEQRDVVVLRHVVGLSPSEIADRLGRSESSIHGLHHRGRRALRTQLEQLELNPCTRRRVAA